LVGSRLCRIPTVTRERTKVKNLVPSKRANLWPKWVAPREKLKASRPVVDEGLFYFAGKEPSFSEKLGSLHTRRVKMKRILASEISQPNFFFS